MKAVSEAGAWSVSEPLSLSFMSSTKTHTSPHCGTCHWMYYVIRENDRNTAQLSCPNLQMIMQSAIANRISVLKMNCGNLLGRCKRIYLLLIRASGGSLLFCTVAFIIYSVEFFSSIETIRKRWQKKETCS